MVYGTLKKFVGIRLDPEAEFNGADLSLHRISATAGVRPTGKREPADKGRQAPGGGRPPGALPLFA